MNELIAVLKNVVMFAPHNVTAYAWVPLIIIWVVIMVVIIADLFSTSKSRVRALFWSVFVILFPAVSGILYAIRCLMINFKSNLTDPPLTS
mgnify:CR=1 FL=1